VTKSILVGLAVLTLSAPAAFAAHHHHHRHHQATTVGQGAGPVAPPAGAMSSGQSQYMKSLQESGYDPKNDYTSGGTMRDH
jgi:hypothetical protein